MEPVSKRAKHSGPGATSSMEPLEAWMRERGVTWAEDAVALSTDASAVVHGVGVVATREIAAGSELFRVPRGACFGARPQSDVDEDEDEAQDSDCQQRMALLLLSEVAAGQDSPWAPLVASLPDPATFADVPWLWSDAAAQVAGTELEEPTRRKTLRLASEADAKAAEAGVDLAEYSRACGVVISHLNPFFGGSIVPFVYVLNCDGGNEPNVAFELSDDGSAVVGRAILDVKAGRELTQAYGDDVAAADLVYRCGFSLPDAVLDADVVSVRVEPGGAPKGAPTSLRLPAPRLRLLEAAGVVQPSPWFDMDDVLTAELGRGGRGLTELYVAVQISRLTAERWAAVEAFAAGTGTGAADSVSASASASASVSASTSKSEAAQKPVDDMDLAALRLVVALADEAPSRDALGAAEAELLRKRRLAAGGSSGEDTDKDKDEDEDEDEDEDDEDLWPHLSPVSDKECWAEVKSLLAAQLELRGGDERNALMRHLCEVEAAILRDHMSLASTAC